MKKRGKIIFSILVSVIFLKLVLAGVNLGNQSHYIEKNYSASEKINGWINISLTDLNPNTTIRDNFGKNMTILQFLRMNNVSYRCGSVSCDFELYASNPQTAKTMAMNANQEKIIGFNINENIINITSIRFNLISNANQSCKSQLEIDFFNDSKIEWINPRQIALSFCNETYSKGCFNINKTLQNYFLGVFPNKYCQKVNLSQGAGFILGTAMNRNGYTGQVAMALFELNGNNITNARCYLPTTPNSGFDNFTCNINYINPKTREVYLCIYSERSTYLQPSIVGYPASGSEACGFYGQGTQPEVASYGLFVASTRFDRIINYITIGNIAQHGFNIAQETKNYIINNYGNMNCLSKNCVIPIKIKSNEQQTIILDNLSLEYETSAGRTTENRFYDVEKRQATINMNYSRINLDKWNVSVPGTYGTYNYSMFIGSTKIFEETINVQRRIEPPRIGNLNKETFIAGIEEIIQVNATSEANITHYKWKFSNDTEIITTTNRLNYTFQRVGNYTLEVTINDSRGLNDSKVFQISVEPPIDIVQSKLNELKNRLGNLTNQINSQNRLYADKIKEVLNLNTIENQLTLIQRNLTSLENEEDYINIARILESIEIPSSVNISNNIQPIEFLPHEEIIDLIAIQGISEEEIEHDREAYLKGLTKWYSENLEVKAGLVEFSLIRKTNESPVPFIWFIELNIIKKDDLEQPFLIIKNLEGISINSDLSVEKKGDYNYIQLSTRESNVVFSTTESIDLLNMPVFISPELSKIPIEEPVVNPPPQQEEKGKWKFFVIIIAIIIVIFIIIYIILQQWYKKKYEDYLFKNKNNLINLLLYIKNSEKAGMTLNDIKNNLKRAGWDPEQINYAIKRHQGKSVGMWEIPISKLKWKTKEQEIATQRVNQAPTGIRKPPITNQPRNITNNPIRKGNLNSINEETQKDYK